VCGEQSRAAMLQAGGVPLAIAVEATAPEIDMPAEPVDRLTADTAAAGTQLELGFTIGGWRRAEVAQPMLAAA
jgi:hypothetical protein